MGARKLDQSSHYYINHFNVAEFCVNMFAEGTLVMEVIIWLVTLVLQRIVATVDDDDDDWYLDQQAMT